MKFKKYLCAICALILLCSMSGCTEEEKFTPKQYDDVIGYIGSNFKASPNVPNVSTYNDVAVYKAQSNDSAIVWVEENSLDKEVIKSLINAKKTVAIIADKSSLDELCQKAGIYQPTQTVEGGIPLLGLLITYATSKDGYDVVGLYCTDHNDSQTDFLAFCSTYKFAKRFQGNKLATTYMGGSKVINNAMCFVNFDEQAYSAVFSTVADFTENPSTLKDIDKYQYSLMSYCDVVPVMSKTTGFTVQVNCGGDGRTLRTVRPNDTLEFDKDTVNWKMNFFFERYFYSSFDVDYEGIMERVTKENDAEYVVWGIRSQKDGILKPTFKSMNLTCAIDCITTESTYKPSTEIIFSTQNDAGEEKEWKYKIASAVPSIASAK